jgi:hypothetical protein
MTTARRRQSLQQRGDHLRRHAAAGEALTASRPTQRTAAQCRRRKRLMLFAAGLFLGTVLPRKHRGFSRELTRSLGEPTNDAFSDGVSG